MLLISYVQLFALPIVQLIDFLHSYTHIMHVVIYLPFTLHLSMYTQCKINENVFSSALLTG